MSFSILAERIFISIFIYPTGTFKPIRLNLPSQFNIQFGSIQSNPVESSSIHFIKTPTGLAQTTNQRFKPMVLNLFRLPNQPFEPLV